MSTYDHPQPTNGPLQVHPDNPRYFADANGRAILLATRLAIPHPSQDGTRRTQCSAH